MVNYGVSRACQPCKQRHKRCDQDRPRCRRCQKAKRECFYEFENPEDLVFRHTSSSYPIQQPTPPEEENAFDSRQTITARPSSSNSGSHAAAETINYQTLVRDFLRDFCVTPADRRVSRGYLDGLPGLLKRVDPFSDIHKAVELAALSNAGMRESRPDLLKQAEKVYAELLNSFRRTIAKIKSNPCTAPTFLTCVLLGLYELITATSDSPGAHNMHLQGLAAILEAAGSPFDHLTALQVFSMANALQIRAPFRTTTKTVEITRDPSTNGIVPKLDTIIAKINPLMRRSGGFPYMASDAIRAYLCELNVLSAELSEWENSQLEQWEPRTLDIEEHIIRAWCVPSLELWPVPTETFFDLYVSSVWNTYRKCHILILNLIEQCFRKMLDDNINITHEEWMTRSQITLRAHTLALAILNTVPYHLTRLNETPLSPPDHLQPHNTSVFLSHLSQSSRPIGGLLLMHPLYVLTQMPIVDIATKEYSRRLLNWIGKHMGIGEAHVLADKKSQVPFMYAAKGHVLVWAGMLMPPPDEVNAEEETFGT